MSDKPEEKKTPAEPKAPEAAKPAAPAPAPAPVPAAAGADRKSVV